MTLDSRYIVTSDVDTYFVDKDTAQALSGGILTFYKDNARNVRKEVFQLSGGPPNYTYTSMGSQITLSTAGTVQNAGGDNEVIYYYPLDEDGNLDLYYVVGQDANGTEQFTREAWPNSGGGAGASNLSSPNENQLSNPTFTNIFINDAVPNILTVTGSTPIEFKIAPDWDLVAIGTGTVTLQRIPVSGSEGILTNPPYVLDIEVSSGLSDCYLRQRFSYNSGLWATTGITSLYLSGSYLIRSETGGVDTVTMYYSDPAGTPVSIINQPYTTNYQRLTGVTTSAIPPSLNAAEGEDGFIDIYLSFPASAHVRISSIQVIPTVSASLATLPFDLNSSNRREAFQGDYYIPRAASKQIDSFLVGWDFTMNPFQSGPPFQITTTPAYIADQTIAQSAASNITMTRAAGTNGLRFAATIPNDACYIMQYLSGDQVKDIIVSRLSSNVFAYQNDSAAGNEITMRIYLFKARSISTIPILPLSIGTIATNGIFTLTPAAVTDSWTEIPRSGLPTAQTILNKVTTTADINNGKNDYGFSQWLDIDVSDADKFAIVVTFQYINIATNFTLNSVSLVPGDLPSRPAAKSSDETLRQCQYYYRKSFLPNVTPASGIPIGAAYGLQTVGSSVTKLYIGPSVLFSTPMRAQPNVTLYNPGGAGSEIIDLNTANDWTGSTVSLLDATGFVTSGTTPATSAVGDLAGVQWTANARLGIVT